MIRNFLRNKKAALDFFSDWAEFFFLVLLFIGIIFAVSSTSAVITYLVGFFSGMMAGRLIYERKEKLRAPYLLIIIGFIMGYVIGNFRYGSRVIIVLLFVFGAALMYYLLDKKIIKDKFI